MQPMLQNPLLLLGERTMVKPKKKGRINYIHIAHLLQLETNNGQHKVMVSLWSL
jgi:hypothetical protein